MTFKEFRVLFGKYINKYYLRYGGILLLGICSLILVDYMQLRIPELYKMVVNGVNEGEVLYEGETVAFDMTFLFKRICTPMFFIVLSMIFGRFLWRVCFFGSANRVEADIRSRMFDRSLLLSQEYYSKNKVGNLMSLYTNDLDTVNECFGWGLMMLFDALFLGILAIAKMIKMNLFLSILSMIPMAFLCVAGFAVCFYLQKKWEERQEAFSKLSDFSQESFSGVAVVKAFVKEAKELLAFQRLNKNNENKNVSFTRLSVLLEISVTLFVESVVCIILGYGGYLVYIGNFNAGELVEFIGYFNAVVWPIMAISQLIEMTSRGRASLKRIGSLLDEKPTVKDASDVEDVDRIDGKIRFEHLTFCYPDREEKVLQDVSFTIEAGESVGIIGKTGSGKTTLVDLILRTYNVPNGTIFLDDRDVNRIPIKTLRKYAAYVPQDNFLFSDTIENNIAFSGEFAENKFESVKAAAVASDIHEDIVEFKEGYQTVLGERGVTVSGGQKQRISIARAVMKEAPILILDDSVSAVDTATEKNILDALKQNRVGKTTILIAHRVSTIEKMDKIIFLDDGKVLAVGTHENLYETCFAYRTMVDLQKLEEERIS